MGDSNSNVDEMLQCPLVDKTIAGNWKSMTVPSTVSTISMGYPHNRDKKSVPIYLIATSTVQCAARLI